MPNDKEISRLISQSLRRKLNDDESAAVESHLRESDESREFAELSALIQTSVSADADYIDQQDSDIFGAALWFVPNERGISYLLKRNSSHRGHD